MSLEIKASPTKEFFVDMITRDIPLDRAILDLIDNSIDGAHRLISNDDFTGLYVKINFDGKYFSILDNCGGIPIDIAKNQAFRFGKPKAYDAPDHSIGRFGIGMKRALFKIGKDILVNSIHEKSKFKIELNVRQWLTIDEWDFNFVEKQEEMLNKKSDCQTEIIVKDLYDNISSEFSEHYFVSELKKQIALAHSLIIKKGFKIEINNESVERKKFNIKYGDNLKPLIVNIPYPSTLDHQVNIKIIAGLDNRNINHGGWYIFCNNRLILDADKSTITGWDTNLDETKEDKINKYHADFAFFRGYVIFDSKDAGLLPWTTTKTGLNSDSEVYKVAYFEMKKIMKKIMIFLTTRSKQESLFKKDELDSNPLTKLIEEDTEIIEFTEVRDANQDFFYKADEPKVILKEPEPDGGTIVYWKTKEELDIMKKYLGVTTNKDVGIATFDYYFELIKE